MIGAPYLAAGAAVAILLAATSGYFTGKSAGEDKVKAEDAQDLKDALKARDATAAKLADLAIVAANKENTRQDTVREVYRDLPQVVSRPVYRNICIDADGAGLLRKAAQAANGDTGADSAQPANGPAKVPTPAK